MEEHLHRFLDPKEVIHHINQQKDDDRIENLMLFSNNSEHLRFHKVQKQLRTVPFVET